MAYTILTDTSANLPAGMLSRLGVEVISFSCFVEGEPYDTAAFDGAAFYARMRRGAAVTTAQINPESYRERFQQVLQRGEDLLYIGMSSGISGSFQSARLAAEELREEFSGRQLFLVDTRAASLGEGLVVLEAAKLRREGKDAAACAKACQSMGDRICQVFTVDDLRYLRRGGRLSNAAAVIGTVLQIKPILKGDEEGKIVAVAKARGRERAIAALAERYNALVRNASLQTVGIAHADDLAGAEKLAALLRRLHPPKDILTVCYEPVTGSHVGPGTIALFFLGDSSVRSK